MVIPSPPPPDLVLGAPVWVWDKYGREPKTLDEYRSRWRREVVIKVTRESYYVDSEGTEKPCARSIRIARESGEAMTGGGDPHRVVVRFTLDGLTENWDRLLWEQHRHSIVNAVRMAPVPTLKVIAELLGYDIVTGKVAEKPVAIVSTVERVRQAVLQALIDMPVDRKDSRRIVGRDVCRTGPTTWWDMDTEKEGDAGWMIDVILTAMQAR